MSVADSGPNHSEVKISRWQRFLPVIIGWAAFLVYSLTLCRGISLTNLPLTATLTGWQSAPVTGQPVLWLLTAPFRWLPPGWVPIAVNLSSSIWAAGSLALLARSVQLLPLNRLRVQRMFLTGHSGRFLRQEAWLPPVLSALACGLSFSFWREATAGTGAMLDLLMLAATLWSLLEYRTSRKRIWLSRAALIWGLTMAENWAALLTLPLILLSAVLLSYSRYLACSQKIRQQPSQRTQAATLLQIQRRRQWRLCQWMFAGLSVSAIPPLFNWLSPDIHWSLVHGILASLRALKQTYTSWYWEYRASTLDTILLLATACVCLTLPLLLKLKREPSYQSSVQGRLQLLGLHLFYALCLTGCLWLTLEPAIGPQAILQKTLNLATPLTGLMYVNALCIGYLAAHFLLIYGADLAAIRWLNGEFKPPPFLPQGSRFITLPAMVILPLALGSLLVVRSLPAITRPNRLALVAYGRQILQSLPTDGGLVLTEDPVKCEVLQGAASQLDSNRWQAADTSQLWSPDYRRHLRLTPATVPADNDNPGEAGLFSWLSNLQSSQPVYYLPTGFGNLLEWFLPEPGVFGQALHPALATRPGAPKLTPAAFASGEQFWNGIWLSTLAACRVPEGLFPANGRWEDKLHLRTLPDEQSHLLLEWYSAALNTWGVELQRSGHLAAAGRRFEQASYLNPDNFIARINLTTSHALLSGRPITFAGSSGIIGQLNDSRQLLRALPRYGPVDDPLFCCLLGSIFTHQKMERQAVEQLQRARELSPTAFAPGILLAELYAGTGQSAELRSTLDQLKSLAASQPQNQALADRLEQFETRIKSRPQTGDDTSPAASPHLNPAPVALENDFQYCIARSNFAGAMQAISRQLVRNPGDLKARVNQAGVFILMGQLTNGLNSLNEILATTNLPLARLDRANVWLKLGNLKAAENDYQAVESSGEELFQANYGLARVAQARHDTNRIMFYLERCLSCAPDPATRLKVKSTLQALALRDKR